VTTTTTTPTIISITRVPRIVDEPDAMQQLTDGLSNALGALRVPEIERAYRSFEAQGPAESDPPGIREWDQQVGDAVIAEVALAVAALLQAAIDKRLPWSSDDR
jgi:hypothetical protein